MNNKHTPDELEDILINNYEYGFHNSVAFSKSVEQAKAEILQYIKEEKQAVKAEILEELIYRCKLNGNRLELKTLEELRLK